MRINRSLLVRPLAALGLTATLLSGCGTLEPAYHRPALPTPNAFPDAVATDTSASAAAVGWKTFFVDPRLRSVVELAIANNSDLRVAVANVQAARAQYRIQRSDLFPKVNASFGATYGREPLSAVTGGTTTGSAAGADHIDEHQYSASLGVSAYEIDLFGRVRSLTKAALETYLSTDEARRASQVSVISETANAWLTLAADRAVLKAAQDTLASSRSSLDIAQKRFSNGVASQLDVRQAETLVDQARADVANDLTTVAQDRNALNLLTGSPVPDALLPELPETQDASGLVLANLPAGLPSDVLLARPDVLQAERTLRADNAQIGAARAAFFPSISLTASGGGTSTALSSLFKGSSGTWSFAPQITLPIFDWGANRANLDYAKAERTAAIAQYEKAIQSAFSEVDNALARRANVGEQIAGQSAQVEAAADTLKLSQARYDRGADTYLNVLVAQRTLYAARQSLIAARLTQWTNTVTLYAALGGGGAD
jgi:multidrug efflux system outer membrane protein